MSRAINAGPKVDTSEFHTVDSSGGKLLLTKCTLKRGKEMLEPDVAVLYRKNRVQAAQLLPPHFWQGESSQVGHIYIGRIQNMAPQLNACFVEIGPNPTGKGRQVCFLPYSEADMPFLINRPWDGKLKAGDELLIQITRDAQKTKACSCTTHISLNDDYFVITAGVSKLLFSGKLDEDWKQEHKEMLMTSMEPVDTAPAYQIMVRTMAGELTKAQLTDRFRHILEQYRQLYETAASRTCFTCLHKQSVQEMDVQFPWKMLVHPWEYEEIVTDSKEIYDYLTGIKSIPQSIRLYQDPLLSLNRLYGLDSKLEEALKPRIWLKSGANLVIEPTEALTVIDVNSGKKGAFKGTDDSALQINLEAAAEIALQMRLRNLSGIIVVDFINMKEKEQERTLLKTLRDAAEGDTSRVHIVDITPLGLVEITRKKVLKPLAEQVKEY